ncbi:MAG TPA: TetR/AcrR family transcriptional regulator [Mycobacterium sp.]|nr:TetR/AcrR family transcriptional regulator [Mycobacterium sp.]
MDALTPRRQRVIRGMDADQRREERRKQLLAATFDLIASNGYANTSIEQICQTAYVGNKAFYELFDSKEDCYLALLTQMAEQIQRQVQRVMMLSSGVDDDDIVGRLVSAFAHALVDDPRVAVVAFGEAAGISPRVERQRRQNRRGAASFIEEFWRARFRADIGRESDVDYHALAVSTVGGLFEAVADWLQQADPHKPRTVDTLVSELTAFVTVVQAGLAARISAI